MRLDPYSSTTSLALIETGVKLENFLRNDTPVDVCLDCYQQLDLDDDLLHPPYGEGEYTCAVCGNKLTDDYSSSSWA